MIKLLKKFFNISYKSIFKFGLKYKMIIVPDHFYVPMANILQLKKDTSWKKKTKMNGLNFNKKTQIKNINKILYPYLEEYKDGKIYNNANNSKIGLGYGFIEAQALFGVIKYFKPKKIIEIGSGVSTFCMLNSGGKNITCIEPNPSNFLKKNKEIKLIKKKIQKVNLDLFKSLSKNDLLFIDSSHTLKINSDLSTIYLEILPILKKGVIIQIHDIFFPYNYQRDADNSYFQWLETQLLQAYLINNKNIEVIFSMSYLHYEEPNALKKLFPLYKPQKDSKGIAKSMFSTNKKNGFFPSSIYLKVK
tara:strand:- start:1011 stop:1922 length:912 start_codon:yes stop_codon:yes gene_type:complete